MVQENFQALFALCLYMNRWKHRQHGYKNQGPKCKQKQQKEISTSGHEKRDSGRLLKTLLEIIKSYLVTFYLTKDIVLYRV